MHPKFGQSIILAAMVGAALLAAPDVHACSCPSPSEMPSIGSLITNADAVFRGTVLDLDIPAERGGNVIALVEVQEVWKGVSTREVVLDLGNGEGRDCSIGDSWGVGQERLVLANRDGEKLSWHDCAPPLQITNAGPALEILGPGQPPPESGRLGTFTGSSSGLGTSAIVLVGLALTLTLALVLMAVAKRRRVERA